MSPKTLENIYTASTRLNIPVEKLIRNDKFKKLVVQGQSKGYSLYGIKQMDYLAKEITQIKKNLLLPSQKALIIETFICEKNNQLTRIAKITGESYYRVFKIIEAHMNDLRLQKHDDSDYNFITLESKINKIQ